MCVIATYRRHFELLIHLQSRVDSVRCLRRHFWYLLDGGLARKTVGQWLCGLSGEEVPLLVKVRWWEGLSVEIWFDFPGLMRTKARARARCVDGREENGTSFRASEGKTSTWLSWGASGTLRRNLTVSQSTLLGISIHYVERKKNIGFSGFGYGLGELDAFISHAPLNLVWIQWSTTWENMTSEKIRFFWPSVLQAGLAFLLLGKLFCLNIEWFSHWTVPSRPPWRIGAESPDLFSEYLEGLWFLGKVNMYLKEKNTLFCSQEWEISALKCFIIAYCRTSASCIKYIAMVWSECLYRLVEIMGWMGLCLCGCWAVEGVVLKD